MKNNPLVYTTQEGIEETKIKRFKITAQGDMEEIKNNP